MKTFVIAFILFPFSFFRINDDFNDLLFLEGTWKVENKETYETWKRGEGNTLKGNSYKIKEGKKIITEELLIKSLNNSMVYQARVLDQNNAQVIDFVWNKDVKDKYSFENLSHDFPKKVQYTKLNDSTLFVEVLGENDKGFFFRMGRRK